MEIAVLSMNKTTRSIAPEPETSNAAREIVESSTFVHRFQFSNVHPAYSTFVVINPGRQLTGLDP